MRTDRAAAITADQSATWPDGLSPSRLKIHSRTSLIALLVGVGLLWPLPLGGAVLMVVASFGLVIAWETELARAVLTPTLIGPAVPRPIRVDPDAPASH